MIEFKVLNHITTLVSMHSLKSGILMFGYSVKLWNSKFIAIKIIATIWEKLSAENFTEPSL